MVSLPQFRMHNTKYNSVGPLSEEESKFIRNEEALQHTLQNLGNDSNILKNSIFTLDFNYQKFLETLSRGELLSYYKYKTTKYLD